MGQLLFVEGGNLTILTSLRSERPELLSKVQTKQGDRGVGCGAELTTVCGQRDQAPQQKQNKKQTKPGDKKKGTNTR